MSEVSFVPEFNQSIRQVTIIGQTYFSILDVFEHYGESGNPSRDWARVKEALEEQGFDTTSNIVDYQFLRSDGRKGRPTSIASFNTFLRIAMVAHLKSWESIRQWMADISEHEAYVSRLPPSTRTPQQTLIQWSVEGLAASQLAQILQVESVLNNSLIEMLFAVSDEYYKELKSKNFTDADATEAVQRAITQMAPRVINNVILRQFEALGMARERALVRLQFAAPLIANYVLSRNVPLTIPKGSSDN